VSEFDNLRNEAEQFAAQEGEQERDIHALCPGTGGARVTKVGFYARADARHITSEAASPDQGNRYARERCDNSDQIP
jgi:hypothetical protein